MSAFGPMYDLPDIMRSGIIILADAKYNQKVKKLMLDEVRKDIKDQAKNMSFIEVEEIMTYLDKISNNLENIENKYEELGIKVLKRKEKQENNEMQIFLRRMLKDYEYDLIPNLKIIRSAIEVVNITREEIGKFLPPVLESSDGVVFRKVIVAEENTDKK